MALPTARAFRCKSSPANAHPTSAPGFSLQSLTQV